MKLDLNAIYGPTSFHTQGAAEFAKLARQYSNGSVDITVHPGGSLGFKGPELLKVVKDGGQVDQIGGATISSRSMIDAVLKAQDLLAKHKAEIVSGEPMKSIRSPRFGSRSKPRLR